MNDFNFDAQFNFSNLSAIQLTKLKITYADIKYIYENNYTSWRPIEGFPIEKYYYFMIGCTSKSQFFELALEYNPEENKVNFNQIQYANESDIKKHYCG